MRVLKVIPDLMLGGSQVYALRAAQKLREHGIEVEICALIPSGPLLAQLQRDQIRLHGTSFADWTSRRRSWVVIGAMNELRRIIARGRFDVVHTYLYWADVVGGWAARMAGCHRLILSRRALHEGRHRRHALEHGIELLTNAIAHELIANSRSVLADSERHERILPRHRTVVYNGIDVASYPAAAPRLQGPIRLVNVAALSPLKGQAYAIAALAILTKKGVDATFTLVGGGEDESNLRALARESKVEDRVIFAGEQLDPRPFLADSDLFVLPSLQEGFSNALLEAMASGLPVVASEVGGNPEALDGEGGRMVPPRHAGALAEAIEELDSDRHRLRKLGRHNRERAVASFSRDESVRRLAEWYQNGPTPVRPQPSSVPLRPR